MSAPRSRTGIKVGSFCCTGLCNVYRPSFWWADRHERRRLTDRPSTMPELTAPRPIKPAPMRWGIHPRCCGTDLDCVWVRAGIRLHGDGAWATRPLGSGSHPQRPCICRESWRGHGFASGLFAATVRSKQFPRHAVPSSRNKFSGPTGPPLRCGRLAMQRARTHARRITPRPQWLRPG